MSKVPCGGFELGDSLVINDGKLDLAPGAGGGLPTGEAPYQQLVTDEYGNAKWEDRLAHDGSVTVILNSGIQFTKISDEVPSWASIDAPTKVWISNGNNLTVPSERYTDLGNGSFAVGDFVLFITTDNVEINGTVFPKKGVYFVKMGDDYISGIASAESDTPEITWDGNIGILKTIDEKFIPDIPAEKLPDIPAIEFNKSIAETIENSSQPSYNVSSFNYSELLNIFNRKNFLIKDTEKYYSPSNFSIFNGNLSIAILVLPKGSDNHLCYALLSCAKDTNRFFRDDYFTISATKK